MPGCTSEAKILLLFRRSLETLYIRLARIFISIPENWLFFMGVLHLDNCAKFPPFILVPFRVCLPRFFGRAGTV